MPTQRIDFKHVREHADFLAVLTHYGLEPQKDGTKPDQHKAFCPFHDDQNPSLKVNTAKNIYNCFVCDSGGNVLDFVTRMEGGDPGRPSDLRQGALRLAELSGIDPSTSTGNTSRRPLRRQKSPPKAQNAVPTRKTPPSPQTEQNEPSAASEDETEDHLDGVPYNRPLSFTLKNLTTTHPFFQSRGITPETIERFGLGIAGRGILKGRLAIPIHNSDGKLVAYCGRYPADDVPEGEPKYKLPPGFRKDLELYNLNRITGETHAVLVESYLSVWRLATFEIPAISCMGRSISKYQIERLHDAGASQVSVMFDGDEPGRAGATSVGLELARAGIWIQIIDLPDGDKPHRCSAEQLHALFSA